MAILLSAIAACRSSSATADASPASAAGDQAKDATAPPPDVVAVAPAVKRYPDEEKPSGVRSHAARAVPAFSATMDEGTWIVETLPAGWNVVELARRGDFMLVEWKPMGRGGYLSGWIRADAVGPPSDAAVACADGSAAYGALACAHECYQASDCAKPARCVRTEPAPDVVGLCITPDGNVAP